MEGVVSNSLLEDPLVGEVRTITRITCDDWQLSLLFFGLLRCSTCLGRSIFDFCLSMVPTVLHLILLYFCVFPPHLCVLLAMLVLEDF